MEISQFEPLPSGTYGIIYADPAWDYKNQTQHSGPGSGPSSASRFHYPTLTLSELKQLPVPSICDTDCLLFLWATSPHLDQAIELGKSWGFSYATIGFIWNKMKTNPGFYTLSQCEICLVFKKGKIPSPRGARNIRQYLEVMRGPHSEKPEEVRHRIEAMFPDQAKIELFARREVPGWTCWGNQIGEEE